MGEGQIKVYVVEPAFHAPFDRIEAVDSCRVPAFHWHYSMAYMCRIWLINYKAKSKKTQRTRSYEELDQSSRLTELSRLD